ncbi:MAG: glycosyltransferase family 4 protein [Chloroflexi bacterium]|nr:glycosyltransferase family 4 protein [Chloroflexota bacterium]
METLANTKPHRIGFVSTRLAGTDGVSLETEKWARVLTYLNCECFYFAGESDWPEECSYTVEEAHFNHPEIQALNADLFDNYQRSSKTSGEVQKIRFYLKEHLYQFVRKFDIELLIIENALSIPMNIPLGLALTELIAETNLPTIAHHHDFAWERQRFKVSAAVDYQWGAFPPMLPSVQHVIINSYAARQLALRTGISSILIPNVMDFDNPPPEPDEYAKDLRDELGINLDEYLLLQPTRVVPRKRIERAVELARRLERPSALLISHASGDEGTAYEAYLQEYAELMGVKVIFAAGRIEYHRGETHDGQKIYSLRDVYQQANLVTYPSTVEGFGNAFLEAIYYRRPVVISTYEIYRRDIQPKGFRVIEFGDFITEDTVLEAREVLSDPALAVEMSEINYELGRRHYSDRILESQLSTLLHACLGFKIEHS